MRFYTDASIQRKPMMLILCTSLLGLGVACAGFFFYERSSFRSGMTSELSALADTLGANTAASLAFNDHKSAQDMLGALRAENHVVGAWLYDGAGQVFAEYQRAGATLNAPGLREDGAQFTPDFLTLFRSIRLDTGKAGVIAIVSDLGALNARVLQYAKITALVIFVSVLATFLVSSRLIRLITDPILHLESVAGRVTEQEDYALRATPGGRDEVGRLIEAFNQMLKKIQERDIELQDARDDLELRVEARTGELQNEVAERKQAETAMRHAKEVAEKASKAKSEFLANMSHEIRTPLNGVMGMTDLALETHLTREQREYLETVKMSADSLLVVINDILDFSKIEAGKIELDVTDFDLREMLENTMKTVALRADEKGLELLCEVAPDVPEVVRTDSTRLRQVLVNLVGNAIKFTDKGEVSVNVRSEALEGQNRILHLTVSDTGIGIPEDKLKLIFDPFAQADTSTTRKYGGTGLGLTISTRLVEMMGGRIWVESEVGRGSKFHFTTRIATADATHAKVGQVAPPEILRGVKVLIVDDNRTNRRILEGMLTRWEMKTTSVESGEEALVALYTAHGAGAPFGLVLTDMHMPHMDGFTLIEQIRQRPELSAAIIMMLTSAGHRGDAARCQKLGVAAYLLKPIRQSELREAIARVLGAVEHDGAIPLVTRFSLHDAREPGSSLHVLLAEDNLVNQRLAVRLLEKRGHHVVVAGNGREALAALQKDHFDLVFMDVQMPEMDGYEATAAIRQKERGASFRQRIIALTAHAMKGDREKCLEAGMDGYLTKPIRPQELDDILENELQNRRVSARVPDLAESAPRNDRGRS
jgi:signal transduction histidine kinase/DNA-binding response OmpR family regulator